MFRRGRYYKAGLALMALLAFSVSIARSEEKNFPPEARKKYDEAKELQDKGLYQEAIKAYEEAIGLGMQGFPRAHLYKANSNLELKQYDKAILQYSKFIADFSIESSCRY
jgi:tetratricopeptide (TPR) repeat protein